MSLQSLIEKGLVALANATIGETTPCDGRRCPNAVVVAEAIFLDHGNKRRKVLYEGWRTGELPSVPIVLETKQGARFHFCGVHCLGTFLGRMRLPAVLASLAAAFLGIFVLVLAVLGGLAIGWQVGLVLLLLSGICFLLTGLGGWAVVQAGRNGGAFRRNYERP